MLDVDEQLRSHEPHLRYRMTQYEETKRAIEDVEGSVANFARVRPPTHAAGRNPHVFLGFPQATDMRSQR